jgi:hypothetical protein
MYISSSLPGAIFLNLCHNFNDIILIKEGEIMIKINGI